MLKELFKEVLEDNSIGRALENTGKNDAALGVCRQYLISLVTIEPRHLGRCHAQRRPASSSETYPLIASRLIDEN
jgi:hypothetical protein